MGSRLVWPSVSLELIAAEWAAMARFPGLMVGWSQGLTVAVGLLYSSLETKLF